MQCHFSRCRYCENRMWRYFKHSHKHYIILLRPKPNCEISIERLEILMKDKVRNYRLLVSIFNTFYILKLVFAVYRRFRFHKHYNHTKISVNNIYLSSFFLLCKIKVHVFNKTTFSYKKICFQIITLYFNNFQGLALERR